MMVSPIHGRSHQVHSAGIHADVFLVGVLFMNGSCDQPSVRPQHEASKLRIDGHIPHPFRHQDFFINLPDSFSNGLNVVWLLSRTVGDPDPARQVNKGDVSPCFFFQLHRQFKKHLCKKGIIFICHRVAGKESMDSKMFGSIAF